MAQHYSLAWLDRWLKNPGEPGYDDADKRLIADGDWRDRYSFYFRSARAFPDRGGKAHRCDDIRAACSDTAVAGGTNSGLHAGNNGGGGALDALLLGLFALPALLRRRRYRTA
jgi:hypothetical protein